jgi:23S rRNA pseudouridine1911/1915/1917 synthase
LGEGERIIRLHVDEAARRLDHYLARALPDVSRATIQRLIRQGLITVDGLASRASSPVKPGMQVVARIPPPTPAAQVSPQAIMLDVVYEDGDLLVVNKPAGMVVHPAAGHYEGTLVNALLARYPHLAAGDEGRPGIVHRLDRDTSGLLVVAKTETALDYLRAQFRSRQVKKTYLALVHGRPPKPEGIVEVPLGRDPRQRKRMAVVAGGRPARTGFRVLEDLGEYSLLSVSLETGRTHQIRVHLAWLGVPVVGDGVYGRRRNRLGLARQALHAWRLAFERPGGRGRLELEAPLPADLEKVLEELRGR